jgi:hypothetical protein
MATWCSLLWARAALNKLCWSSAQQRITASMQASGSCSKENDSLSPCLQMERKMTSKGSKK